MAIVKKSDRSGDGQVQAPGGVRPAGQPRMPHAPRPVKAPVQVHQGPGHELLQKLPKDPLSLRPSAESFFRPQRDAKNTYIPPADPRLAPSTSQSGQQQDLYEAAQARLERDPNAQAEQNPYRIVLDIARDPLAQAAVIAVLMQLKERERLRERMLGRMWRSITFETRRSASGEALPDKLVAVHRSGVSIEIPLVLHDPQGQTPTDDELGLTRQPQGRRIVWPEHFGESDEQRAIVDHDLQQLVRRVRGYLTGEALPARD